VGLDGATFDLLDPIVRHGWMPNLEALMARGSRGILRSTVPVLSGPAWVTFMTGKCPGRHGIFDFGVRRRAYLNKMFRSDLLEDLTVWELVDRAEKESVVVNVPMTYPPHPIRGAVVTGLMTPGTDAEFTHPKELRQEIEERWQGYLIDVPMKGNGNHAASFLKKYLHNTRLRGELSMELLRRHDWSYAMICFVGSDRIQHLLYPQIADPSKAPTDVRKGLEAYYRLVDDYLGRMVYLAGNDAFIQVISDHGFARCQSNFLVNEWLAHEGFLVKAKGATRSPLLGILRWAKRLGLTYRRAQSILARFGIERFSLEKMDGLSHFVRSVDWAATRAFYGSTDGISVNLKGREPEGTVEPGADYERVREEIMAGLRRLRHPEGDEALFRNVFRREEIYQGPHLEDAPDVILETHQCKITGDLPPAGSSSFLSPPSLWQGVHHRDGIYLAAGPGIREGVELEPAGLEDVAPTTLYGLGLPVPEDMDGAVMEFLFEPVHLAANPVRQSGSARRGGDGASGAAGEDQELLEEQLRNLGYL
jgi:predicted AlkP superfamily phosphohydrolase/phosphomutase